MEFLVLGDRFPARNAGVVRRAKINSRDSDTKREKLTDMPAAKEWNLRCKKDQE